MQYSTLLFLVVLAVLPATLAGQIHFPRISPESTLQQRVGLTDFTIVYGRPGRRNRQIFGERVPYGRIWRVGANESTKFTVSDTILVAGQMLPAGTYALYAFPEADAWEIVFHHNINHWGDGRDQYNPAEDALRLRLLPEVLRDTVETLTIEFTNFSHQSADCTISWENLRVRIPIEVDTHRKVMRAIQMQLQATPSADTYYQAARYLQESGREPAQALQWLHEALALGGDTYYYHRVKSLVEAQLGQYQAAIQSAQRSLELAAQQNKDEFVRENALHIAQWQNILKR